MAPKRSAVFAVAGVVIAAAFVAGLVASDGWKFNSPIALSDEPHSNTALGAPELESGNPDQNLGNGGPIYNAQPAAPQIAAGTNLVTLLPSHSQIGAEWAIQPVVAPPPHSVNASDYQNSRLSPGKLIKFNTNPSTNSVVEGGYFKSEKSGSTSVSVFLAAYNSTQGPLDAYSSSTQFSIEGYQKFDTSSVSNSVCFGAFYGNLDPGQRTEIFCYKGNVYYEVAADSDADGDTKATALMFAKSVANNLGPNIPANSQISVPQS